MKLIAVALCAMAGFSFSSQTALAQTPPNSSPSATAPVGKGLGYGDMASNGQKFSDLANLSSDEMGKLPFVVRMEVKKWKQAQLDEAVV